jgi:hypothetical protein
MPFFEVVLIALSMLVLAGIALRLAWLALVPSSRPGEVTLNRDGSFSMVCAVCGAPAHVSPGALEKLSSAEKALVVRERPSVIGQNLVEFACPSCDASHCYNARGQSMELIGVNLYQGQHFQANCKECQRRIARPPWRPGAFDGKVEQAPGDLTSLGLQCTLCSAICCVDCCKQATRNRTADGTLLCPRCFRGPNSRFYHPVAGTAMEPGDHGRH